MVREARGGGGPRPFSGEEGKLLRHPHQRANRAFDTKKAFYLTTCDPLSSHFLASYVYGRDAFERSGSVRLPFLASRADKSQSPMHNNFLWGGRRRRSRDKVGGPLGRRRSYPTERWAVRMGALPSHPKLWSPPGKDLDHPANRRPANSFHLPPLGPHHPNHQRAPNLIGQDLDETFFLLVKAVAFEKAYKVPVEDLIDYLVHDEYLNHEYQPNLHRLITFLDTLQCPEGKEVTIHEFKDIANSLNQKTVGGRTNDGAHDARGDDGGGGAASSAMVVVVDDDDKEEVQVIERPKQGVAVDLLKYRERLAAVYQDDYGMAPERSLAGPVTTHEVAPYGAVDRPKWGPEEEELMRRAEVQLEAMRLCRQEAGGKDRRTLLEELEARMTNKDAIVKKRLARLTNEQEAEVQRIINQGRDTDVLVSRFNVDLKRADLRTLKPGIWLNDEVINFFFNLLRERDERLAEEKKDHRKSHFFNSFFITKLMDDSGAYNYANVRRWTRSVDLFAVDKVFIPVNLAKTHWCLAVIFMQEKKIQYYDSMGGSGSKYLNGLKRYLQDEHMNKKNQPLDMSDWTLIHGSCETPQQENGLDCGVFLSATAYLVSEDLPLKMSQKDMPNFRKKMILSCVKAQVI